MPPTGEVNKGVGKEFELQRVNRYLRIAIITRFFAIVGVAAGIQLPTMHPLDYKILLVVLGTEVIANLLYYAVGFKRWPNAAFHFSGLIDIAAIGLLVYLTGGESSHFVPLFSLVIVFNCIYYGRQGVLTATVPSLIALLIAAATSHEFMSGPTFVLTAGVWGALSFLSAAVGEKERVDRTSLHEQASRNEQQANEILAVYETSNSIGSHLEAEALLSAAIEKTQALATSMWGNVVSAISLVDADMTKLRVIRVEGESAKAGVETVLELKSIPENLTQTLLNQKGFFARVKDLSEIADTFHLPHGATVFGAPIFSGEEFMGTLSIRSTEGAEPTAQQLEVLSTIANHIASALARLKMIEVEQRAREKATALFEVARDLGEIKDVNEVLRRIAEAAVVITESDAAGVWMIGADQQIVEPSGWAVKSDDSPDLEAIGRLGPFKISQLSTLLEEGSVEFEDLSDQSAPIREVAAAFHVSRVVAFPIFAIGRAAGILWIGRQDEGRKFSMAHMQLGESIVGLAAVAIGNLILYDTEMKRSRENAALFEVAQLVAASLDKQEVVERIAQASITATGANWISIMMVDGHQLVPTTFKTAVKDQAAWHFGKVEMTNELHQFLREGKTAVFALTNPLLPIQWAKSMEFERLTIVPLTIRNEALGAILVDMQSEAGVAAPFRVVDGIASLAAAAVDNANRYESEKEAVAELKKLDRLKTDFISTASHELRSPLTSITGYAKTLLRRGSDFTDEQRQEFLQVIDHQAKQLARLVDELFTVSNIEEGRINISLHPLNLAELISNLVVAMKLRTDRHTFAVTIPDDFLPIVADESKLTEIISNLIDNAIKYSPDGGSIEVRAKALDGETHIMVSDTGPGMPPDVVDNVFEKFFQADRRPQAGGAGLGLYIVQQLVRAHDGRIWVESELGKGTTFHVALPQRRATDRIAVDN